MVEPKQKPKSKPKKSIEDYVEKYLGVHPRYFIYEGLGLKVDIWKLEHDGKNFRGFIPHLKELGEL